MKLLFLTASLFIFFVLEGNGNPVLLSSSGSQLDTLIPANPLPNCPLGYSQPANTNWDKCYKVFTNYKSRKDAAAQCKSNNGTLASVPNGFVNSYIYSLASQSGATSLWLGIKCFGSDPTQCMNDDGSLFNYNSFQSGQPTSNDICVYMSTIGRDSQKWSTFDCEQNFQYACELSAGAFNNPVPSTTVRPSTISYSLGCPQNYTLFQGMCYSKVYTGQWGANRTDQGAACRQVPGGNLATIKNADVANFVEKELYCSNTQYRIGLICPNITVSGDTSSCVWDDGTPFSYNNFYIGDPIWNMSPCVAVNAEKWFNHNPCSALYSCAACQAPPQ